MFNYSLLNLQRATDGAHKLRAVLGNGMRPNIWRQFLDRFGKDIHVLEFYAATEGSFGTINLANDFGCIGKVSPFLSVIILKLFNYAYVLFHYFNKYT